MAATALITSTSNPRIKQIRALARHGERQATALCVVEGIFHTGEALAAGAVDYLVYAPDLLVSDFGRGLVAQADAKEIPVYRASAEVMRAVSSRDNPQGLLAVARQRRTQLDELSAEEHAWLVAVIAPQDPGNVGAILRTIDAAGASGLIVEVHPDPAGAMSDGAQSLDFPLFADLASRVHPERDAKARLAVNS